MQVDLLQSLLEEFRDDSRYEGTYHTRDKQQIEWTTSEENGDVETITVFKDPDHSFINEVIAGMLF